MAKEAIHEAVQERLRLSLVWMNRWRVFRPSLDIDKAVLLLWVSIVPYVVDNRRHKHVKWHNKVYFVALRDELSLLQADQKLNDLLIGLVNVNLVSKSLLGKPNCENGIDYLLQVLSSDRPHELDDLLLNQVTVVIKQALIEALNLFWFRLVLVQQLLL